MKFHYRWKELELFSIQTFSNVISFIQFSLIPINNVLGRSNNLNDFISNNFESIITLFNEPLDYIHKYNEIISPVRSALSPLLIFAIIIYLYSIFFLPSWRLILFFFDLFTPAAFLIGIVFISRKSEEQRKTSIILIIVGVIYILIRLFFVIFPIIKRKCIKWHIQCARLITSIFLSRLKKSNDEDYINSANHQVHKYIDQNEKSIQFDDDHFSYKTRIIDFLVTIVIWLVNLILIIIGWKKILNKLYSGQQLDDLSYICSLISYCIFSGISLRFIINIIWLIKPKQELIFQIFITLKFFAYKAMHFLANISILPILKTAMDSIDIDYITCQEGYYFDTKSNTNTILQYFMKREGKYCIPCTIKSIETSQKCYDVCFSYDETDVILKTINVTNGELHAIYLIQLLLIFVYYTSLFIILYRCVYCFILDVVKNLPGPTQNIECKFQTLIMEIKAAPLTVFRSYKYNNTLYSFSFTGSKLFIVFWTTQLLSGNVELPYMDYLKIRIIFPFIFSFTSFIIAESQLFTSPYISILHNIVNGISYGFSALFITLIGLQAARFFRIPTKVGNILIILIIIIPIITTLITLLFVKKDPLLAPTKFDIVKIQKWDKKLNKLFQFKYEKAKSISKRKKKNNKHQNEVNEEIEANNDFNVDEILLEDEPSLSVGDYQNDNNTEREHDELIGQFDLLKLAPIVIQEQLNKINLKNNNDTNPDYSDFKQNVHETWCKTDLFEKDFDVAINDMTNVSKKLINCISYNNLLRLFNLSMVFSSAMLGWILGEGINKWLKISGPNSLNYYLRCNMLNNGTYPAFGSY